MAEAEEDLEFEGGVDEGIFSPGGDQRWKVDADPELKRLVNPPYVNIVRLVVLKPCCPKDKQWEQGTAFLVACKSDTHWHYFTAGHVLLCNTHGKLAVEVQVWASRTSTEDGEFIRTLQLDESRQYTYRLDTKKYDTDEWYDVKTEYRENYSDQKKRLEHDVGVIALSKDWVRPKLVKGPLLRALPLAELEQSYIRCFVTGFPVEVKVGRVEMKLNEEMFEHQGDVQREIKGGPMWKYTIDTTEGQSGSPVLTMDTTTVLGVHVRNNKAKGYNQAVVLTQELVMRVESGKL